MEFKGLPSFPEPLAQPSPCPAPRSQCCITGLPAKYKDPLTGQPYATLAAFKAIRAQLVRVDVLKNASACTMIDL